MLQWSGMPVNIRKNIKKNSAMSNMFHEWFMQNNLFDGVKNPTERLKYFLKEIQRRVLSEQVIICSLDKNKQSLNVWETAPAKSEPILPENLTIDILKFINGSDKTWYLRDFSKNELISFGLKQEECYSVIVKNIYQYSDFQTAILIVNYSTILETKIFDFLEFIFPVLSVLVQNIFLYNELIKKNEKMKNWAKNVEERIKQGTKSIIEKEARYIAMFENATDGIVVLSSAGRILEINKAACEIFANKKSELLEHNLSEFTDEKNKLAQFIKKALSGTQIGPTNIKLKTFSGELTDIEITMKYVWYRGKKVVQCFMRDVSLRRILSQGLKNAKEKYETLVESSLVGVFILRDGKIQYLNQIFEKMTGYMRSELIGKRYADLIKHDEKFVFENKIKNELNGNQFEIRFITKKGEERIGEVRLNRAIVNGQSEIIGNIIDITDQKKLEAELFENEKMKSISTLAGGIAHDFNNLLGGILGYASLILSEISEDHEYYNDIKAIADTTKKAAELTNHLLAFARGGRYRVEQIELNQLIKNVIGILAHTPDNFIKFKFKSNNDKIFVNGDMQQIRQVLTNIIINSIEASSNDAVIEIITKTTKIKEETDLNGFHLKKGDFVKVTIRDYGRGMDEITQNQMFEPFFSTKVSGTGKGLGLALVYGVIKNHSGALEVKSEVNKGTEFTFYLPVCKRQAEKTRSAVKKSDNVSGHIFIVDDEKVIRDVSKKMLEREGFDVVTASNGKQALEIFNERWKEISVVILDLVMPDMTGEEVFKKMKQIDKNVKVIFASGYAPEDREEMKNFTYERFLQKPFRPQDLISEIEKVSN
ncbi:hypothetical protein DRQ07_02340 [candidate division KSB1 bacterium]|nr:MAG: hypothetical protein DRQ07_02340 [candidate division KSB1 bacterium]